MKLRKFAAITLALVMVFAMSANAFAAGNSTTSVVSSIAYYKSQPGDLGVEVSWNESEDRYDVALPDTRGNDFLLTALILRKTMRCTAQQATLSLPKRIFRLRLAAVCRLLCRLNSPQAARWTSL